MDRDRVFSEPREQIVDFVFDEQVAAVFPDMIRRSVPGYEIVLPMTGLIAARHARPGTRCYDLGCSLGATSLAMARRLDAAGIEDCPVVGVDRSPAMIAEAQRLLAGHSRIELQLGDMRDVSLEPASVVVMNYTLQFVPPDARLPLLRRIRSALVSGGVLLVAEKIRFEEASTQGLLESLHLDFKRANGYSELEISQKRQALERVLLPDTVREHRERFRAAGFGCCETWFQCLNWAAFAVFCE
jgi:tRNA (cmo5U34)-methyltransferase